MLITLTRPRTINGTAYKMGDTVNVHADNGEILIRQGAAYGDGAVPCAPKVSPNRMKFASLVAKLDPHQEDYAVQVAAPDAERGAREKIIKDLGKAVRLRVGPFALALPDGAKDGNDIVDGPVDCLLAALDEAIERFVVDRY